jgi:hypothetical protein
MGSTLAAVILAAQTADEDTAEGLGISITPSAGGGPGGDAFATLLNYVAWVGYRVAALAFVVSVIALAFGRMNQHAGAETIGRKGMLYAAGSIALIAAADRLLAFAAVIGGQA